MNTFTNEEIVMIQEVAENITQKGYEYDLPVLLEQCLSEHEGEYREAIDHALVEYFVMALNIPTCTFAFCREKGLTELVLDKPLDLMPLYVGSEGTLTFEKIIATWRLKLGK